MAGIISLFFIILFVTGCAVPTATEVLQPTSSPTLATTPTPTIDWFPATPTPTFLPINSPTPQPTLSVEREGVSELLIQDDFTDPRQWLLTQNGAGNIAFGNQNLTLAISKENANLTSLSQHTLSSNFYLEISVENAICQSEDQYGIDFWHQSAGDYHRLLVNCAGQYRLELIQSGRSIVLHDWETGTKIMVGAPVTNRLGLWVYEGQFQLFINDTFQFEEQISRDRRGALGVFAKTISGNAMTIRFSDLKIYRVEQN
jgi:hypothetical protein